MKRQLRPTSLIAFLLTGLAVALAGCTAETASQHVPREYTIEELLSNISFSQASFTHDGQHVLVSSDESGIFNVVSIPIDGGGHVPLTHSTDDACLVVSGFPNDDRFLFRSDQGGNELWHLYVQDPDGRVTDLFPGEGHRVVFARWAADHESFIVTSNQRDSRFMDVYEVAVEGYETELIFQDDEGLEFVDVSPDRRTLAFTKVDTRANSDVWLYDRSAEEMRVVTKHEGEMVNESSGFSPDGRSLVYRSDEGSEFQYLVKYDLMSGQKQTLLAPEWDTFSASYSRGGKYLMVSINEDAATKIVVLDASTMQPIELTNIPAANISTLRMAPAEDAIAFYASSGARPNDLLYYRLGSTGPTALTRSLNPAVASEDLVEAEVVRFSSYDGTVVPGLLYVPHTATVDAKVPALVWVHGGPGGQSRVGYRALIQYLVNHGYVVYAINNRGSSGYGKTFFGADDRKHGDADLDDCVASKRMLTDTGVVDPAKIGIIGGSYGGYMVLAALTYRPDAFEVGVDIFGVANWVRTLESMPAWWESYREALYRELGHPQDDREYLTSISPLFHASKIQRPLMVLQGANDPRVLKVESDEIVDAVRANGVAVEYVVFDDEGHGFRKKENRRTGYEQILTFLNEHLRGDSGAL